MSTSAFLTTEETESQLKNPILIVDKEAVIGRELVLKLGKNVRVVFVAKTKPSFPDEYAANILFVPFTSKIPRIPFGNYSLFFIVDSLSSKIREALPSFADKAEKDKAPAVFITGLKDLDESLMGLMANYPKLKTLIHGDIFDEKFSLDQEATVNKFLYESLTNGKVEVEQSGLEKTYPVYLEDVIDSILESVFGSHGSSKIFFAFPKYPPTCLGLARAIQRANPDIKVDFSKNKEVPVRIIPSSGVYLLENNYPLQKRISRVILKGLNHKADKYDFRKYKKQKITREKTKRKALLRPFLLGLMFLLLLPFVITFSFSSLGVVSLLSAQSNFSKGNIPGTSGWAQAANSFFSLADAAYQPFHIQVEFVGLADAVSPIRQNIEAGRDLSKATLSFADAYEKLSAILAGTSANPVRDFSEANLGLSDGLVLIRKVQEGKDINGKVLSKIKENEGLLNFAANIQTVLPHLVGINEKKVYLILFQNNMELRPGGGFIGSYGLLSLDKGKIAEFSINDVYDADGQLKGHVEPPFAIRRYLPSEHWYLRDSNYNLDFPQAASASAFFLKAELGKQVDGVIGINVSFMESVLKVLGPVHVSEYNQKVDSENFLRLAQEHSQKNFFPGSTQKKDFLSATFRALQNTFLEKKNFSYLTLAKVVQEGILKKDVLLVSSDQSVQGLFTVNKWSSSLWDNRGVRSGTVNDFLGISEANLGVNKVNYFIDRKVSQNTVVGDDGKISSEINISYENKSDGQWPGGDYKNYLRVVFPRNTILSYVSIDGQLQKITDAITDPIVYENKSFTPPAELEVEKTTQNGKDIFGILVNVPMGSKKTITLDYILSEKFDFSNPSSSYNLYIFKQPGVKNIPFDFNFSYPSSHAVTSVSSGIIKQNGSLTLEKDIIRDENILVNLSKKE